MSAILLTCVAGHKRWGAEIDSGKPCPECAAYARGWAEAIAAAAKLIDDAAEGQGWFDMDPEAIRTLTRNVRALTRPSLPGAGQ